jgi:hypothetical protein
LFSFDGLIFWRIIKWNLSTLEEKMFLKKPYFFSLFTSTIGLALLLFATSFALTLSWYFGNEILIGFMRLGIMSFLDILVSLPLAIVFAALGIYVWLPRRRLHHIRNSESEPKQPSLVYYTWMFSLAVFSLLADILAIGWVLLVWVVAHFPDFPPSVEKQQVFTVFLIGHLLFLVGQIVIAFLIARSYWRLLQSTRANHAVENT